MTKRKRPEVKPKEQLEPAEQARDDAAQEKARAEFKKLFPNARKRDAPPSRRTGK